jgi:ribosomal protein S4E
MARGPRKHMKRLNAPRHWMLGKLGGTWAPRPSEGPHKLRECLPLSLILRNRLKLALTRRETIMIIARKLVQVDNKVRTDLNYPAGFQDVVSIPRTDETFRLLYDTKGRFVLHRIPKEEATWKLAKVVRVQKASKASIGRVPGVAGQAGTIPFLVTHDGRTIRFADPAIKVHDTVKIDLTTGKTIGHIPFSVGNTVMVTKGANVGRVGSLVNRERHPGSFDVVHVRDRRGHVFATRLENIFTIGEGSNVQISLPNQKGVKLSPLEEREHRMGKKIDVA